MSLSRISAITRSTSSSFSGVMTLPLWSTRSSTSSTLSRVTSGGGSPERVSYMSSRYMRRVTSVSRVPLVAMNAMRAPLRSRKALAATVEP